MLPSGLLNPNAQNLVGSGCVVHLGNLFEELEKLEKKGLSNGRDRLYISDRGLRAHVYINFWNTGRQTDKFIVR